MVDILAQREELDAALRHSKHSGYVTARQRCRSTSCGG
jgi:hypothetical protein